MKIIDLLNKIANGEEVPEKIKLKGYDYIFTLREDCAGYRWYGEEKTNEDFGESICQNLEFVLRCEVEILDDEEKGLPEKLNWNKNDFTYPEGNLMSEETADMLMEIQDKVNSIIDYLKSKGEDE